MRQKHGTRMSAGRVRTGVDGEFRRDLPGTVPHHFDLRGRPDAFGTKAILWVLPVLATVAHVALTALGLWDFSREYDSLDVRARVELLTATTAYGAWAIFAVTRGVVAVGLGRRRDLGRWFLPAVLGAPAVLILAGSLRLR
jgi:hypothetical protein